MPEGTIIGLEISPISNFSISFLILLDNTFLLIQPKDPKLFLTCNTKFYYSFIESNTFNTFYNLFIFNLNFFLVFEIINNSFKRKISIVSGLSSIFFLIFLYLKLFYLEI